MFSASVMKTLPAEPPSLNVPGLCTSALAVRRLVLRPAETSSPVCPARLRPGADPNTDPEPGSVTLTCAAAAGHLHVSSEQTRPPSLGGQLSQPPGCAHGWGRQRFWTWEWNRDLRGTPERSVEAPEASPLSSAGSPGGCRRLSDGWPLAAAGRLYRPAAGGRAPPTGPDVTPFLLGLFLPLWH